MVYVRGQSRHEGEKRMSMNHRATRVLLAVALSSAVVVVSSVSASAQPVAPTCFGQEPTITGTHPGDTIPGTEGDDVIVGLGGDDVVNALGGNDRVCGNAGNDVLVGGAGNDRLRGNAGDDTLVTFDGVQGNDLAIGGPGNDTCVIDADDFTVGCENEVVVTPSTT
jgi:Ca2+-binding RTX toxin-like protein